MRWGPLPRSTQSVLGPAHPPLASAFGLQESGWSRARQPSGMSWTPAQQAAAQVSLGGQLQGPSGPAAPPQQVRALPEQVWIQPLPCHPLVAPRLAGASGPQPRRCCGLAAAPLPVPEDGRGFHPVGQNAVRMKLRAAPGACACAQVRTPSPVGTPRPPAVCHPRACRWPCPRKMLRRS